MRLLLAILCGMCMESGTSVRGGHEWGEDLSCTDALQDGVAFARAPVFDRVRAYRMCLRLRPDDIEVRHVHALSRTRASRPTLRPSPT